MCVPPSITVLRSCLRRGGRYVTSSIRFPAALGNLTTVSRPPLGGCPRVPMQETREHDHPWAVEFFHRVTWPQNQTAQISFFTSEYSVRKPAGAFRFVELWQRYSPTCCATVTDVYVRAGVLSTMVQFSSWRSGTRLGVQSACK